MSEPIVIGIDLGTTNTLAYYLKNGKPTPIRFSGSPLLPSVIYVKDDGTVLVGKKAQVQGLIAPQNMVRSAKTYMGEPQPYVHADAGCDRSAQNCESGRPQENESRT